MPSICSKAASNMWLAFDAIATLCVLKQPQFCLNHWQEEDKVLASGMRGRAIALSVIDYSHSLQHSDLFTAKLQQLPWHLSKLPPGCGFWFKTLLSFCGWNLVHCQHYPMRLTVIFRIVHVIYSTTFWLLFVYIYTVQLYLQINVSKFIRMEEYVKKQNKSK